MTDQREPRHAQDGVRQTELGRAVCQKHLVRIQQDRRGLEVCTATQRRRPGRAGGAGGQSDLSLLPPQNIKAPQVKSRTVQRPFQAVIAALQLRGSVLVGEKVSVAERNCVSDPPQQQKMNYVMHFRPRHSKVQLASHQNDSSLSPHRMNTTHRGILLCCIILLGAFILCESWTNVRKDTNRQTFRHTNTEADQHNYQFQTRVLGN